MEPFISLIEGKVNVQFPTGNDALPVLLYPKPVGNDAIPLVKDAMPIDKE